MISIAIIPTPKKTPRASGTASRPSPISAVKGRLRRRRFDDEVCERQANRKRNGERPCERPERCQLPTFNGQKHSPQSRLWVGDLGDLEWARRVAIEAWDAFGHLDVLVNNAAAPKRRPVDQRGGQGGGPELGQREPGADATLGNADFPEIEPAPGRYVKVRTN